ncbi:MAG: T9SS type A sorting domain-containing protein, partial [candidate division WOR-3 bacterium]
EFEDWLVGPTGNYTAKCSTELTGDEFGDNDKKQVSFTIQTGTPPGWSIRESMPPLVNVSKWHIKDGGALVGVGANLYAFRGTKTNQFKKYVPGSGWSDVETIPFGYKYPRANPPTINKKFPGKGAALCYDNNNTIYATRGNGTREFWAYSISEDTWQIQESIPVPKGVKGGTALAFKEGKVYLLAGALKKTETNNFFEFDTATKSWSVSTPLELGSYNKPWKDGSCLAVCGDYIYALKGGDKNNLFYAYDGSGWTAKESLPIQDSLYGSYKKKLLVKDGGAMTSDGSVIYAVKGGGTNVFWKYTPGSPGIWTMDDSIPRLWKKSVVKTGSAMAYANGKIYLLKGNKSPEFWCYTPYPKENIKPTVADMNIPSTMAKNLTATYEFSFEVMPNPFKKLTTIHYTVPIADNVSIKLYNVSGRLIKTLVNKHLNAGSYTTTLTNIGRGVYFLKYEDNTNKKEVKLIVQ